MFEIISTEEFRDWFAALRDDEARAKIAVRLRRLGQGNPGDVKPIGRGLSELRIKHGPGYRVYFARKGARLLLLLVGGDKSSQRKDIARAHELYDDYEVHGEKD